HQSRFFFFLSSRRRHTRSKRDWSSDVCSSDLKAYLPDGKRGVHLRDLRGGPLQQAGLLRRPGGGRRAGPALQPPLHLRRLGTGRSEERRVGKEWRCRWAPDHTKTKLDERRRTI